MKKIYFKLVILGCCSLSVVASGLTGGGGSTGGGGTTGGGGGASSVIGGSTATGNNESYETLTSSAQKTSFLTGIAELSNSSNSSIKLARATGSLAHENGALSVDNGDYKFSDSDGANGNKLYSDSGSTLTFKTNFKGEYKHSTPYQQSYKIGNDIVIVNGVIGVATSNTDIQTSRNSILTGEAEAVLVTSELGIDLYTDKVTINAYFDTGKADIKIDQLKAKDLVSGQNANTPVAVIEIKGMAINNGEFSGGDIKTYSAQTGTIEGKLPVKVVGKNEVGVVHGAFYGWTDNKTQPAEAAGQFLLQGENGSLSGTFMTKVK